MFTRDLVVLENLKWERLSLPANREALSG
jgi:hypothetical protein